MSRRKTSIVRWGVLLGLLGALALDAQFFFSASLTQRFHVGDSATNAANITVQCFGGLINSTNDVRIQIPPALNMTWDPAANPTFSESEANLIFDPNPPGCYQSADRILFVAVQKAAFVAGVDTFTLGNLRFANFSAPSPPANLFMSVDGGTTFLTPDRNLFIPDPGPRTIRIADFPSVATSAAQTLSPGQTVAMSALTITESTDATNPGIWNSTNLRVTIPAGVGVTWNTGDNVAACSGSAVPTRVVATPTVAFEDGNRTIVIPVISDFAGSETVVVSGLSFVVSPTATDTTFRLGVRTGGAGNATVHRQDANLKTIVGLPSMSSAANQRFTRGDPSTLAQNITITESPGTSKIGPADDIQIIIPGSLNLEWDQTIGAVACSGTAQGAGHIAAAPAVTYPNARTVRIPVISTFGSSQTVTISNLRFANFGGTSGLAGLQLEVDSGRVGVEATDTANIGVGAPTISSSGAQIFQTSPPGPGTVAMATLTVQEDGTIPRIGTSPGRVSQLRIVIPAAFNMTWQGLTPATTSGKLSTAVSYAGGNKTLILTATADFVANETATVSGLNFVLTPAASTPDNLELFMSASGTATATDLDNQIIAIGGIALIASNASQAFTTNDPATVAQPIRITDANGVASITAAALTGDIRITIPAGFNMTWNTGIGSVGIAAPPSGPSAAGKVSSTLLPYEDGGRTAVLNVTANFAINEGFVVSGLEFANFSDASPPSNLELLVTPGGPAANSDTQTIAIGRPTISTPGNQFFGVGDVNSVLTPTTCATITITDDGTTARIDSAREVRIRIPAGLNMTWDPAVTAPTITWLTAGPSKVSGTLLSYEDGNKTAVVDVTTPFVGGDSFTIAGLRFLNIAAEGGPLSLGLEVNNAGSVPNANDASTILLSNRPTIVSTTTLDTDSNGSIDRLVVTFSEPIDQTTASALSGTGFTLAGYVIANGTPGAPNANSVTYRLAETGLPDTGAQPVLSYDPTTGDLNDLQTLETMSLTSGSQFDGASPVIVGFQAVDSDGNGRLNSVVVTFSENLTAGQEDLNDWVLIDANGTTNLLAGLTTASFVISNNTLTITMTNTDGTAGVPRYQYNEDGFGGVLQDGSGNVVPFLTNNLPPVSNAGPDQILAPTKVTLNGSSSSDPDGQPVRYRWTQIGGPAVTLSSDTDPKPSFLATTAATYSFQLEVSDSLATAIDTVDVMILNVPPISRTLFDQVQSVGQDGRIFGFFSSDINGDPLTFLWTQVSGPPVAPANPTFVSTTFTPTLPGVYVYELTATDTAANTSTHRIVVRIHSGVNVVPTANAGPDQSAPVNTLVTLDGRLSSTPSGNVGGLTYAWTCASPSISLTGATPTFTPSFPGTYTFDLVVTDGTVDSAPDSVTVNVFPANRPPVAMASKLSPVLHPTVGQLVTLDSTGSVDPEGSPLSYAWVQLKGPSVLLSSLSAQRPTFTAVAPGTYEFQLLVTDGSNWSLPSVVKFPILPNSSYAPPTVVPSLVTATKPNGHVDASVTPTVSMSATVGGTFTNWWWEQIGGPAVVLSTTSIPPPFNTFPADVDPIDFTPPVAGVYSFRVTAGDFNTGVLDIRTIDVVVDTAANNAPVASAGPTQTGIAAGQTVTLNGSATDVAPGPAGPFTASWTQLSGPPVTLTNPDTVQPTFVPPVAGTYVFQLNVTDGSASSGPSLVQVEVSGPTVVLHGGSSGGCGLGAESLLFLVLLLAARRQMRG